jgi:hypothetical protein
MITIYQIQMTNSEVDAFNAGHPVEKIDVKRRLMFGAKKFDPSMLKHFDAVYEVETNDLEEAFEITNIWENGHLVRALPGTRGHSSSVGDIFRKGDGFYMVDSWGFTPLALFNDEVEIIEEE